MPREWNGKVYLNTEESYTLLGISYLTFKKAEEDYGLVAKQFVGQQRQRFFLKDAIELIKNSSTDEATVAKVITQIKELQES